MRFHNNIDLGRIRARGDFPMLKLSRPSLTESDSQFLRHYCRPGELLKTSSFIFILSQSHNARVVFPHKNTRIKTRCTQLDLLNWTKIIFRLRFTKKRNNFPKSHYSRSNKILKKRKEREELLSYPCSNEG